MNHFIDFDPYTIGEHHRQLRAETDSLRLQERLRKNRKVRRSSRHLPRSSVAGSLSVKRGRLSSVLADDKIRRSISPGPRPRITSPDGFVQESLAGGVKTLWTLR
jgi:hypothetical protein